MKIKYKSERIKDASFLPYNSQSYAGNGFHIVDQSDASNGIKNLNVFFVSGDIVLFLDSKERFEEIISSFLKDQQEEVKTFNSHEPTIERIEENKLSEDFALKLLSIALNKEKFKDVKL